MFLKLSLIYYIFWYIHHKNRIIALFQKIHDFPLLNKSLLDILFSNITKDIMSLLIDSLYRHSRPWINNLFRDNDHQCRIILANHKIDHECLHILLLERELFERFLRLWRFLWLWILILKLFLRKELLRCNNLRLICRSNFSLF